MKNGLFRAALAVSTLGLPFAAQAAPVVFNSATATFNQTFDRNWAPSEMIDSVTSGVNGWAIFNPASGTSSQTALFALASPLAANSYSFTFTISQNFLQNDPFNKHTLGNFALGYTTDAVPTLASAFSALTINAASSTDAGTTFSLLGGGELLVGGSDPNSATYTIMASINSASPITGIFLNVIDDPANGLPTGGPGRQPSNGNFVVSEFVLDAIAGPGGIPEPATWAMMIAGFGLVGGAMRRKSSLAAVTG